MTPVSQLAARRFMRKSVPATAPAAGCGTAGSCAAPQSRWSVIICANTENSMSVFVIRTSRARLWI